MQEAWKRVQARGTPRDQADALRESQNAAQVAQGEQAACEGKTAARALADRNLKAARARIGELDEALRATQDLAGHPGRALFSPETCMENVPHMLRIWDDLQPMERQFVKQAISAFAMLTGLYDEIKAKGAAERESEFEGQRPGQGAFTMPVATPGTAGR